MDDYKKTSGITYADCGLDDLDSCSSPNQTQDSTVQACLIDAFGACKPAQARIDIIFIEGYAHTDLFLVEPDGKGGCKLEYFVYNTEDRYSEQTRSECTKVKIDSCGLLAADECVLKEKR